MPHWSCRMRSAHRSSHDMDCEVLSAISDAFFRSSLWLIRHRRASRTRSTWPIIKARIFCSVETGTVTFAFTLINLVLFLIYTDNYLYMILYSNDLLLGLNARRAGDEVSTIN
ncbi:hypothetical protein L218DRAFT_67039 [Marasmius fiardii PR-910]|nr:hypothetical protein L218DRAFT_67039 [Marasmius fiardii PR-910]